MNLIKLRRQEFAARVSEIRAVQAAGRRRLDDLFQSMLHRSEKGGRLLCFGLGAGRESSKARLPTLIPEEPQNRAKIVYNQHQRRRHHHGNATVTGLGTDRTVGG